MEHNYNDDELLKRVKPPFSRSKEDVWAEMEAQMEETKQPVEDHPKVVSIFKKYRFAVAASVALFLGVSAFLKFYTKEINTQLGEHMVHELPDGSKVTLNVGTQLSYQPYWWIFDRTIEMEGEAFFDVQKGERFRVISKAGITEVLGTSFNINTRNYYNVYCKTGKVKVENRTSKEDIIIQPNELVQIKGAEPLRVIKVSKPNVILGWKEMKFIFDKENIMNVFAEIERQYNVEISLELDDELGQKFTGVFNRKENVKTTLDIICQTFGWQYKKQKAGSYIITKR
ncbi:MAG: DUF4974 domain-containing protein [Flavobacteriales bacterium]|nr:DUF4974 domain-containing protein [Flavobacteriales bacterium]